MYVTSILLLFLVSNAFAAGAKDFQKQFNGLGIDTKQTTCTVPLDSLLRLVKGKQTQDDQDTKFVYLGCAEYYASSVRKTFRDAKESCESRDMRLATPNTEAKFQCLRKDIINNGLKADYWIAASLEEDEGYWVWNTTGDIAILDPYWDDEKPSGLPKNRAIIRGTNRLLHDFTHDYKHYYICEKNKSV